MTSFFPPVLCRSHPCDWAVPRPAPVRLPQTVALSQPSAYSVWGRAGKGSPRSHRLPHPGLCVSMCLSVHRGNLKKTKHVCYTFCHMPFFEWFKFWMRLILEENNFKCYIINNCFLFVLTEAQPPCETAEWLWPFYNISTHGGHAYN